MASAAALALGPGAVPGAPSPRHGGELEGVGPEPLALHQKMNPLRIVRARARIRFTRLEQTIRHSPQTPNPRRIHNVRRPRRINARGPGGNADRAKADSIAVHLDIVISSHFSTPSRRCSHRRRTPSPPAWPAPRANRCCPSPPDSSGSGGGTGVRARSTPRGSLRRCPE